MNKPSVIISIFASLLAGVLVAGGPDTVKENPPVKRMVSDSVLVVNTTALGKNIIGYSGITPVEIYVTNGKVSEVKPLPGYFWSVIKSGLLSSWNGLTPKEGRELKVDAVSGATFSSDAIIRNVRAGLRYLDEQQ